MSRESGERGGGAGAALKYARIIFLNTGRRLLILGRRLVLRWQRRRLTRACGRLGFQVLDSLETGEVNPLLTEAVKDTLNQARDLKALLDRQTQAIAAIRARMAQAWE
ncbi:MAG: hypothetical protein FJ128_09165 [Deltaproteobacteria bacterium]|nr:hypothetical protein [Deltaproteobacteria bacterium]